MKPNSFFSILVFLTADTELLIPCSGTSPVWMLFPSFLPCISFSWDFLWSPVLLSPGRPPALDCSPWLPFPGPPAPSIGWEAAACRFPEATLSPARSLTLLQSNGDAGSKITPEDDSAEVNTVDLTLAFFLSFKDDFKKFQPKHTCLQNVFSL